MLSLTSELPVQFLRMQTSKLPLVVLQVVPILAEKKDTMDITHLGLNSSSTIGTGPCCH